MRILTVTSLYPNPYQPHLAPFNRQQLRHLARRHEVRVLAPVMWTMELGKRWRGASSLPAGRQRHDDGMVIDHPHYWYPPWLFRRFYGHFYLASVRRAFARAVTEFRPDLVFAPWAFPDGWAAVRLGHKVGLPVVLQVHGSDVLLLSCYPEKQKRTATAVRAADGIVAVSQDLADQVVRLGAAPGRVRVVYRGVDAGLFRPGPKSEARARLSLPAEVPTILFVGNLLSVKGPDLLVDACGILVREGVRFRACLVGQGDIEPRLRERVGQLGLGEHVRFLGSLPHAQLPDWYRAADVLVVPSRSEGVPNVLLEAAACGTPFVASRVGGIPEVTGLGRGQLVPPEDAAALAGAIRSVLGTPPAEGAALRSWDLAADELCDFLEGVAGNIRADTLNGLSA